MTLNRLRPPILERRIAESARKPVDMRAFLFPGNTCTFTIFPLDVDRAFAKMDKIRDSRPLRAAAGLGPVMPSRCGTTRPRRHRFQAKEDCCFCRGS